MYHHATNIDNEASGVPVSEYQLTQHEFSDIQLGKHSGQDISQSRQCHTSLHGRVYYQMMECLGRPPRPETTLDGVTTVDAQTQDGTDQLQASSRMSEHNSVLQDVKVVSEERSEKEATLGKILRSLDVEIGSAGGHDDSDERQGPIDYQTQRTNVSLENTTSASSRSFSTVAGKCSIGVHLREVTLKEEPL
ncbi:hypothetical protein Tco_0093739 [Tanacetum coccineum]